MTDINAAAKSRRIAMLIDGDNAQPTLIEKMLIEASKYGTAIIRRVYGDWTEANMSGWKKTLQSHAIQPIQQFRYTTGKNATDSALIIDAMDLLHQGIAECFCLVSSDSDYTRLATRIREKGLFVIGIGKKTTPRAFVAACDVFVYTENLTSEVKPVSIQGGRGKNAKPTPDSSPETVAGDPTPLILQAFEIAVQENGQATLSALGNALRQINPGFDTRSYGYKQLSLLLRARSDLFTLDETANYVRLVNQQTDRPRRPTPKTHK